MSRKAIILMMIMGLVSVFSSAAWADQMNYPPTALNGWAQMRAAAGQLQMEMVQPSEKARKQWGMMRGWTRGFKDFQIAAGPGEDREQVFNYLNRTLLAMRHAQEQLTALRGVDQNSAANRRQAVNLLLRLDYLQGQLLRHYLEPNRAVREIMGDRQVVELLLLTSIGSYLSSAANTVQDALTLGYDDFKKAAFWEYMSKTDLLLTGMVARRSDPAQFSLDGLYHRIWSIKRTIAEKGDAVLTTLSKGNKPEPGDLDHFSFARLDIWPTYRHVAAAMMDQPSRKMGLAQATAEPTPGLMELVELSEGVLKFYMLHQQGSLAEKGPELARTMKAKLAAFGKLAGVGQADRARLTKYHARATKLIEEMSKPAKKNLAEETLEMSSLAYSVNRMFRYAVEESAGGKPIDPKSAAVMLAAEAIQNYLAAVEALHLATEDVVPGALVGGFWSALNRADFSLLALKKMTPKKSWNLFIPLREAKGKMAEIGDEFIRATIAGDKKEQADLMLKLKKHLVVAGADYRVLCESIIKGSWTIGLHWGFFPAF